jgi:Kef-type K+ transport system membrane component KefB
MRGIADGFFIPLYFVVLGAQLDLRGLVEAPSIIALAVALTALNVAIHLTVARLSRRPLSAGLAASAQLGVPAAVASLGLAEHVISAPVATAIVAAACVSLGVCALGVERLIRSEQAAPEAAVS